MEIVRCKIGLSAYVASGFFPVLLSADPRFKMSEHVAFIENIGH
jgi:hypothetical protein